MISDLNTKENSHWPIGLFSLFIDKIQCLNFLDFAISLTLVQLRLKILMGFIRSTLL